MSEETNTESDYSNSATKLKQFGDCTRAMENVWLLKTELSADRIQQGLIEHFRGGDDKLVVLQLQSGGDWAGHGGEEQAALLYWIHTYIGKVSYIPDGWKPTKRVKDE
jgi:hypothetical protein